MIQQMAASILGYLDFRVIAVGGCVINKTVIIGYVH